ncbi:hypothetical protein [uncultured Methylophaga sp.]|uniref:hypothetical protein n=1 Tax=uncultured Methylophaga sp. TaxID=285271 RepID=UPI0026219916|nr:hypothetical protein [uncultured Methylophaga sp.]
MTPTEILEKKYGHEINCIALIKPNSSLAKQLDLNDPTYCILEYYPGIAPVIIKWGDGSFNSVEDAKHIDDLVLLTDLDQDCVDEVFGF